MTVCAERRASLFGVREEAMKSLEEARKEKRIGKGLEAKLRVEADASVFALLTKYSASLKEFFNVSQVEAAPRAAEGFTPEALPADGEKCNRCWNYRTDVTDFLTWQGVCGRCQDALKQMGYGDHA